MVSWLVSFSVYQYLTELGLPWDWHLNFCKKYFFAEMSCSVPLNSAALLQCKNQCFFSLILESNRFSKSLSRWISVYLLEASTHLELVERFNSSDLWSVHSASGWCNDNEPRIQKKAGYFHSQCKPYRSHLHNIINYRQIYNGLH